MKLRELAICTFLGILLLPQFLLAQNLPNPDYVPETFVYKEVDKHQILADVYKFADVEKRPVIIWIHSGALIFGSRNNLKEYQVMKYLQAGYIVVAIDHRLAPETKLPEIIEDLEDAIYWVRKEGPELFGADPDKIAVIGHSAGGYLSLMSGYRVDPPPQAVVSFYGYGDLTGSWYKEPSPHYTQNEEAVTRDEAMSTVGETTISSPPGFRWPNGRGKFYLYCRQQGVWPMEVAGHDPTTNSDWFMEYEPVHNVSALYPPTLLLHGEVDEDVPFSKSVDMVDQFKKHGVEVEFIRDPKWDHMFDNNKANGHVVDQVVEFLDRHLK